MKTIDIRTPQNVKIEVPLSGLGLRIAAFALDQFIFWVTIFLLSAIFFSLIGLDEDLREFLFVTVILPFYFFYSPVFESLWNGQTPGKRVIGIRVIRLDGSEVGLNEVLTRWLMRLPDIFASVGTLAMLLVASGRFEQRMGDILAGTIVVQSKATRRISLRQLHDLDTIDSYTPAYPVVRRLSEEDALLVKRVIARYDRYCNRAHRAALKDLSTHLQKVLGLTAPDQTTDREFLSTVLKDYIVLTR